MTGTSLQSSLEGDFAWTAPVQISLHWLYPLCRTLCKSRPKCEFAASVRKLLQLLESHVCCLHELLVLKPTVFHH